jgi:hypothetical protein
LFLSVTVLLDSEIDKLGIPNFVEQKCGRIEEQVELLKQKLWMIYQGEAFNGKPTKTARSHGKKFQVTVEKETSRILVRLIISRLVFSCD